MSLSRERVYINLYSMNNIVRSLNDEDLIVWWLQEGVPDDCHTLDEIRECFNEEVYPDSELASEYERMARIFAKLVRNATENGYDRWTFVGQTFEDVANSKKQ